MYSSASNWTLSLGVSQLLQTCVLLVFWAIQQQCLMWSHMWSCAFWSIQQQNYVVTCMWVHTWYLSRAPRTSFSVQCKFFQNEQKKLTLFCVIIWHFLCKVVWFIQCVYYSQNVMFLDSSSVNQCVISHTLCNLCVFSFIFTQTKFAFTLSV